MCFLFPFWSPRNCIWPMASNRRIDATLPIRSVVANDDSKQSHNLDIDSHPKNHTIPTACVPSQLLSIAFSLEPLCSKDLSLSFVIVVIWWDKRIAHCKSLIHSNTLWMQWSMFHHQIPRVPTNIHIHQPHRQLWILPLPRLLLLRMSRIIWHWKTSLFVFMFCRFFFKFSRIPFLLLIRSCSTQFNMNVSKHALSTKMLSSAQNHFYVATSRPPACRTIKFLHRLIIQYHSWLRCCSNNSYDMLFIWSESGYGILLLMSASRWTAKHNFAEQRTREDNCSYVNLIAAATFVVASQR